MTNFSNNKNLTASLDELVEGHAEYLYNYAYRYFRSEDKAEELVQETFLAATQAIAGFKGESSARTWLVSILRFKIIDRVRLKSHDNLVNYDDLNEQTHAQLFDEVEHWRNETGPIAWNTSADKIINQKQFIAVLDNCLSKLPERVRQIFILREIEGQSREEISGDLALSSSNIGVILHRARIFLQQCLQTNWLQKKWDKKQGDEKLL